MPCLAPGTCWLSCVRMSGCSLVLTRVLVSCCTFFDISLSAGRQATGTQLQLQAPNYSCSYSYSYRHPVVCLRASVQCVRQVAYPLSLLGVSIRAMEDALKGLRDGRVPGHDALGSFGSIQDAVGFNVRPAACMWLACCCACPVCLATQGTRMSFVTASAGTRQLFHAVLDAFTFVAFQEAIACAACPAKNLTASAASTYSLYRCCTAGVL